MAAPGAALGSVAVNTEAYVQLLGLGLDGCGTVNSALLVFDKTRFLFNAGEGFQRFCVEHRLRLTKLSHIFLTRTDSSASNGLPGLFLTMQDVALGAGAPPVNVSLYGPPRVEGLRRSIGTVVSTQRHVRVQTRPLGEPPSGAAPAAPAYEDALVRITHVLLSTSVDASDPEPPQPKRLRLQEARAESGGEEEPTSPPRFVRPEAPAVETQPSVCYLCQLADVPGKFDVARAEALGVPRGPLRGALCRGETITLPGSGATVAPGDVCAPPTPGPAVLVLDIPSEAHLAAALRTLLDHPPLAAALQRGALASVVHLSPASVAALPAYGALREALQSAGASPATAHIMANERAAGSPSVFRSSAQLQLRLSELHPQLFPRPLLCGEQPLPAGPSATLVAGENLLRWRLRPLNAAGLHHGSVPPRLLLQSLQEAIATDAPEALRLARTAREAWAATCSAPGLPPAVARLAAGGAAAAPRLHFLGTGAAIPSKYRNVSGILFQDPARGSVVLDCGEGSLGQLRRCLGEEGALEVLRTLRMAWISHIHADHHVGLLSLLAARRLALGGAAAPLLPVVGPSPLRRLLETHAREVEPLAAVFVDLADTTAVRQARILADAALPAGAGGAMAEATRATAPPNFPLFLDAVAALGLSRLHSVPVVHCAHAYAAVLEEAPPAGAGPGWKVVYSGDTRPCDSLVEAARGASLLVHEATFEDALEEEAVAKRHSLTREAVATGARAGAFRTLLTHFSQRYPKTPVIDASFEESTAIAFDSMALNLADLAALPSMLPALRALFPGGREEEEEAPEEGW